MKNKAFARCLAVLMLSLLAILVLVVSSCGKRERKSDKYSFYESVVDSSKPIAWGSDRDIYVFCDDSTWKLLQILLRKTLERETFIVINEKYFTLVKAEMKDIDKLLQYKNLLFIGDLKSKGAVSEHLRKSMLPRQSERVENSGGEMYVAKNRWVKDQLVVYMVGNNLENLLKLNILQANRMYDLFLNRLGERLAYQTYQTKLIPEDFFSDYPFTLKIPESYRLFSNDRANHFLSFLYRIRSESRDFPDKYISVYYEDVQTDSLKLEWLLEKRKQIALKYYDGDEFDPKMLRSEKLSFGKYQAWHIIGPWKNMKHDIGGGFQSFAFYDAQQKRAYLIDNAVYFPAGDKLPELLEMQKISSTFKVK
jgi:hypothetical protein